MGNHNNVPTTAIEAVDTKRRDSICTDNKNYRNCDKIYEELSNELKNK